MECEIRPMRRGDWGTVRAIYAQAIEKGGATFTAQCPGYCQWNRAHHRACRLVLLDGATTTGFGVLSPVSRRAVYAGVAEVSIYIDERHTGQGLGEKLLTRLCDESERAGFWSLYSAVFADNAASIRLHEKCGFRKIGYRERIARDRFGVWRDTVLFERRSAAV